MCQLMHQTCTGEIYGSFHLGSEGDVQDLVKTLKRALEWEEIFQPLVNLCVNSTLDIHDKSIQADIQGICEIWKKFLEQKDQS